MPIQELGHDPISRDELIQVRPVPLSEIRPAPENDTLYKPFDPTDKANRALIASVKARGVLEPLVLTLDGYILSGHRRYGAAVAARLAVVPARVEGITRSDPDFIPRLREFNRQRQKTREEQGRESVVEASPKEAYRALIEHREERERVEVETLQIEGSMKRARITDAKAPMLGAVLQVLESRRKFWPLSDRQIHYALLNAPPLIHAKKPDSKYRNDLPSYKALTDLLTRARLTGEVPMSAIADPTRPVSIWDVHDVPATFEARQIDGFLKGYRRNLQQSQPNHIEIVGEKNTVESTLKPVAGRYGISLTIGRGFSSLEPRYKMAQRFKRSGKGKLILLVLSDFDPSGEEICQSFARSLRDDFGVRLELLKVALTAAQVSRFGLPPMLQAKKTDSRAAKFTARHGSDVYELEALAPEVLQAELRAAVDSVMDVRAFNQELSAEEQDAAYLDTRRRLAHIALRESE